MGDTVVVERVIAADPAVLRDLVSDVTRMGEWSPENTSARWLEGESPGSVGSRFVSTNQNGSKSWKTVAMVTLSEPDAFEFRVTTGPFGVAFWTYEFEVSGHGTRVIETWVDLRSRLLRVVTPFFTGVKDRTEHNRRTMEKTLDALKAYAENSTPA